MLINADPTWVFTQVFVLGWIQLAMMAAPLIASYFGGAQKQKSQQQTQSTAQFAPEFQGIADVLGPMMQHRLNNQFKLPESYATRGIQDINRTYDLAGQDLSNRLTARGLGSSPIAGAAERRMVGDRAGAISNFQGTLPFVQREFQNQDIAQALSTLQLGRGSNSMTNSSSGGGVGGGLSGLGSMLGFMMANGMFGGQGGGSGGMIPTTGWRPPMAGYPAGINGRM